MTNTIAVKTQMKRIQRGFTLIELVVVIIILGVLAAVAVPKFIDLSSEAMDASVQSVAGAISSSTAINFGAFAANPAKAGVTRLNAANVCTVTLLGPLLTGGTTTQLLPGSTSVVYSIAAAPTGNCSGASAGGTTVACVVNAVKGSSTRSATASVVCTG
jgi:prepilin-type N-terminal cleavage/methylation domain-containing protein